MMPFRVNGGRRCFIGSFCILFQFHFNMFQKNILGVFRGFRENRSAGGQFVTASVAPAGDPADRFRCAYLAALRGAGAVLAAAPAGAGSKRKRSGNAWVLMDAAAPAFGAWSKFFAGWSATRAAVETGVSIVITDSDSDAFFAEVGRFLTAVEDFIGQDASEHLRAS